MTKEQILLEIDGQELFNYYLKSYHNKPYLKQGTLISNPFLVRNQDTPSFNIFYTNNDQWRFYDFATGESGDIFDLIMRLKKCDFKEALNLIQEDFNLSN